LLCKPFYGTKVFTKSSCRRATYVLERGDISAKLIEKAAPRISDFT